MQETSFAVKPCSPSGGVPLETTEFSPAGWTADRFEATLGAPDLAGESNRQLSTEQAASFVAELAAPTPDETPSGAKVPEPATLVLLGVGMIATSGLSRIKRQPKSVLRVAVTRFGMALGL